MRRIGLLIILIVLLLAPAAAQDGLNLPTELYVLLNSGQVERYGIGTAGVDMVTPEDAYILDFSVAPDGNWMAFRTEAGLTLYHMYDENVYTTVEGEAADVPPLRGRGATMAWTPSGDALAYTTLYGARVYFNDGSDTPPFTDIETTNLLHLQWSPDGSFLAAEAEDDIWWIYRREGTQMTLASAIPSSRGTAWVGPAQIVFAPAEGGLILMDMANANAQQQIRDTSWEYGLPYYRADGTLLVFGRRANDPQVDPGFGVLQEVTFVEGGGVNVEETGNGPVELEGARWAPRGQLLLAFRGGAMALIHPPSGQGFTLPITSAVSYGWGPLHPERVEGAMIPTDGYFLAPDSDEVIQVWHIQPSGAPPFTVTPADEDVTAFAMSPDQTAVAYVSGGTLWYYRDDEPQALADASEETSDLSFSPDGSSLVYVLPGDEGGIWRVPVSGRSGFRAALLRESTLCAQHQRHAGRGPRQRNDDAERAGFEHG